MCVDITLWEHMQSTLRSKKATKKAIEYLLFFVGLCLSALMFKTLMIHTDNTQLMDKSLKVLQTGEWTHHGNAATKMGSLPGSFLTVVTTLPMMVWFSPYAAMAGVLLFHILSYLILRNLGFKYVRNFEPLVLVVFYWLNPWRVEEAELYNPGYLFLFSSLYFLCAYKLKDQKSFFYSALLVLCLGFCFQVHFSVLILGISFLFLYFMKQIKVNYWGITTGLVLVALSLLPWFLELQHHQVEAIQTQSDTFIGKNLLLVYPVLKAILYFFRMGSLYCGGHVLAEVQFSWIANETLRQIVTYLSKTIMWTVAVATLLLSFKYFGQFFKTYKKNKTSRNFFDYFLMSMFIGLVGSSGLSPVEFTHWHLILCFPVIMFFIACEPEKYFAQKYVDLWPKRKSLVLAAASIIFIFWNIFASLDSHSHNFKNDYEHDFKIHYNLTQNE